MNLKECHWTVLLNSFLFQEIDREEAVQIAKTSGAFLEVQKGECVFSPTDYTPMLVIILEGRLSVENDHVLLHHLSAGDTFGVASLWGNEGTYVSTVTAQKNSKLYTVTKEELSEIFDNSRQMAVNYISFLSGRIVFLNEKVRLYSCQSVEGKVLEYIQQNIDSDGGMQVNSQQLSRQLGIGRASLYRAFDTLQESAMLEKSGKQIKLLRKDFG